jgi:hypothetical protein
LLRQVLNVCPALWTLHFLFALRADMVKHQREEVCRFGGWEEVEGSIPGYLVQVATLRDIIVSLSPWYLMEHVPGKDANAEVDAKLADELSEWTDAAIERAVFS